MRETRLSGSEGGVAPLAPPLPLSCESELMMKTGESPSPVETCDHRVPEGQPRRREAG
jgi:hypothetical protein